MEDTLTIFDIGNVLVEVDHSPFVNALSDNLPPEEVKHLLFHEFDVGKLHDLGAFMDFTDTIRSVLGGSWGDDFLINLYPTVIKRPIENMISLKDRLSEKHATGLLTDSHRITRDYIEAKWPGTLDVTLERNAFSDVVGKTKPAPEMYEPFVGIAERTYYIDDVWENLHFPLSIGWTGIHYVHGSSGPIRLGDALYCAGSADDIATILRAHDLNI